MIDPILRPSIELCSEHETGTHSLSASRYGKEERGIWIFRKPEGQIEALFEKPLILLFVCDIIYLDTVTICYGMDSVKTKIYGVLVNSIFSEILIVSSVLRGKKVGIDLLFSLSGCNKMDGINLSFLLMQSEQCLGDYLGAQADYGQKYIFH